MEPQTYYQRNRTKLLEYQKKYESNKAKNLTDKQKETKREYNRYYYHLVRKFNPEFKEKAKILASKYKSLHPTKKKIRIKKSPKPKKLKEKRIKLKTQINQIKKCKLIINTSPEPVLI
jgi:hypothetical protein